MVLYVVHVKGEAVELNNQEKEILALLAAGKSNAEIGQALHFSAGVITARLSRLYIKLDVSGRREARKWWIDQASNEGVVQGINREVLSAANLAAFTKTAHEIPPRQRQVLNALADNPQASLEQIAAILSIGKVALREHLNRVWWRSGMQLDEDSQTRKRDVITAAWLAVRESLQ